MKSIMLKELLISDIKFDKTLADGLDTTQLQESILIHGLVMPIYIDEKYNVISGLRRLIACKRLKKVTISGSILGKEAAINFILFCSQPRQLTKGDRRNCVERLRNLGLSVKEISVKTDLSVTTIYRWLKLY